MTDCGNADTFSKNAALRVCLVSPLPPPYGGIAHWTMLLHQYAAKQNGIHFLQLDIASRWRAIDELAVLKRLVGGFLQLLVNILKLIILFFKRPDVMHLTSSVQLAVFRDIAFTLLARLFRIPIVYHLHLGRIPGIAAANTLEWRMLVRAMRIVSLVMVLDSATAKVIVNTLPGIRVEVVPNPVDFDKFKALTHKDKPLKSVFFLGWIIPSKGVEELVKAWAELGLEGWELLLAGPGNIAYQERLLQCYRPKNTRFLGELDHNKAMVYMAQCDLFVLPSHTEGFPNVVLEAMALGKPIIATEVGAIPEMLNNDCGIMIKPKDVDALKVAIVNLANDKKLRNSYGERSFNKARKEFSLDKVFIRITNIWKSVAINF